MDPGDIEKLRRHRFVLVKDMDSELVVDYLLSTDILNDLHAKEINKRQDNKEKNRQLLDTLKTRGSEAFRKFLEALHATNQHALAKLLDGHDQTVTTNENIEISIKEVQSSQTNLAKISETAQQLLKEMYLARFEKVYPFSLPFTFDIGNTWVSLALKEEKKDSQVTEDCAKLLKRAFEKTKMLIIEGDPATGKTSLMRRLAYEWATGKQELQHYALVLYAEFRKVREKTFKSIAELVLGNLEEYLDGKDFEILGLLLNDKQICLQYSTLVLLDGYDESSLEKQCSELSSYTNEKTIKKPLSFHIVITTRKGYLSNLRGREGRFVFAEVLGFTTKQQKEKYVHNHFLSSEVDNKRKIAAVHSLLDNNQNLNKLAETPLFLTFICLVHERIADGTLLELYCNIIWWLIDRHQQDFPERDIPALFGFENGSSDKFETIQDHYLHFPQLHCLGNMALRNLEENVFKPSDYEKFNLQPIIEQVGLLRKEKKHDSSFRLVTSLYFPHRTIQEFLAAFYWFYSNDPTSEYLLSNSHLNLSGRDKSEELVQKKSFKTEYERFLSRIALSDKMPIQAEKRKYYFERITFITLNVTFDAFNTTAGFNNKLLNWFLSQCTNVRYIQLSGINNSARHVDNMLNDSSEHHGSIIASKMSSPTVFSFSDLIMLHSLTFGDSDSDSRFTFVANSQLSFTNCPSLKELKFWRCEMKSSINLGIATLPAINIVEFSGCNTDLAAWQSISDQIRNSTVKYFQHVFGEDFNKEFLIHLQKCNYVVQTEITIVSYKIRQNDLLSFSDLIKLHSLTFAGCTFEANSQLSYANCPSLKNLNFVKCVMESNSNLGITTLPTIATVEFDECNVDLAAWQSITYQMTNSSVKCLQLKFGKEFYREILICLQECNSIEKLEIEIKISSYNICQNDLFSFNDLMKLHSLTFDECTLRANSQLSFTNCQSLKTLKFWKCEMNSSTKLGIATLPAIDTVEFKECNIDLATWQSITDDISNSSVKCLKLEFGDFFAIFPLIEFNMEFLSHLQKCNNIEMEITMLYYKIRHNDLFSFSDLVKLHSLTFEGYIFEPNSQLSFTNCPSLKNLHYHKCEISSSTNLAIATLPAIDIVEFSRCDIDLATWRTITEQIANSSVKCLKLSADYFANECFPEFLPYLQKCDRIQQIHVHDVYDSEHQYILNHFEEEVTANFAQTAQKLPGLTSITILCSYSNILAESKRLEERNKERIEKAGQERNPSFLIKYVE